MEVSKSSQSPTGAPLIENKSAAGGLDIDLVSLRKVFNIPSGKHVEVQPPKVISKSNLCRQVAGASPAVSNIRQSPAATTAPVPTRPTTWPVNSTMPFVKTSPSSVLNPMASPNSKLQQQQQPQKRTMQLVRVVQRKTVDAGDRLKSTSTTLSRVVGASSVIPNPRKRPLASSVSAVSPVRVVSSETSASQQHSRRLQEVPLSSPPTTATQNSTATPLDLLADLAIQQSSQQLSPRQPKLSPPEAPKKRVSPNVLKTSPSVQPFEVTPERSTSAADQSKSNNKLPKHILVADGKEMVLRLPDSIGRIRENGLDYDLIPVPPGVLLSPASDLVKSFLRARVAEATTEDKLEEDEGDSVRSASTLSANSTGECGNRSRSMVDLLATPTKLPPTEQITLDMDSLIRPISPMAKSPTTDVHDPNYAAGFLTGLQYFCQQQQQLARMSSVPGPDDEPGTPVAYGEKLDRVIESVMQKATSSCSMRPSTSAESSIEETIRQVANSEVEIDLDRLHYTPLRWGEDNECRLERTSEDTVVDVIDSVLDKAKTLVPDMPNDPVDMMSPEDRIAYYQNLYNVRYWQRQHSDHRNSARTRPFSGKNPWMARKMASKILKQRVSPSNIAAPKGAKRRKMAHNDDASMNARLRDEQLDNVISDVRHKAEQMSNQARLLSPPKKRRPITTKIGPRRSDEQTMTCARVRLPTYSERAARCVPYDRFRRGFIPFYFIRHPERTRQYTPRSVNIARLNGQEARRQYTLAPSLPLEMQYSRFARGARVSVYLEKSPIHGVGVFANEDIENGTLVLEYSGEIIRTSLTDKREAEYRRKGIGTYMFTLDSDYVIDATLKATAARFVNHSCSPNCQAKTVSTDQGKKILLYACTFIPAHTELCYDYKMQKEDEKISCYCGAPNCKKFMN